MRMIWLNDWKHSSSIAILYVRIAIKKHDKTNIWIEFRLFGLGFAIFRSLGQGDV